jgi:hypothetical protein
MAGTPPRKPTVIQYFRTGLFTRRSALFAPLRVIGIQVILLNDALIDGQDMELLDTYQLQRRAGFTRICSQQLAAGEIVNQFYSGRNSANTVFPLFDSNQRFATFSPTAITTIWNKPSPAQAYMSLVGTQMYLANGAANGQKRYDTVAATLHGMGIAAPTAMPTVTPPTATLSGTTFWQPGFTYADGLIFLDSNGNVQQCDGGVTTGTQEPIWATTLFANTPELAPGTGKWHNLGAPGVWQASFAYSVNAGIVIIDSNSNIQQLQNAGGTSGTTTPAWSTTVGAITTDNTVNWKCLGNSGPLSVFSGYSYMFVYSTQAPTVAGGYYHRSDGSPVTISTGPIFGPYNYPVKGAYSTNTDVGSVDVYRTKDGGSSFDYAGSVPNNTAGGTWTFNDSILDANLNSELIIPLGTELLSDPPPGSPGSHAPTGDAIGQLSWWQGRFWAISGSKVYFTSGPDVDNGDPYACWPPANVFTFPGPVQAITGTSAGLMLVWLNDAIKIIAGGPTTLSYYPDDLLDNFGISSPNCVSKDGDTVRALTTQGQVFEMNVSTKTEISAFIGDIVENFPAPSSYLTTHRDGLDNGVFLGDGSTNVLRYGLNVQAWSPIYKPVGGMQALKSIETSPGNYTLCAARSGAGAFLLGRNLSAFQDDGQNYSACFATIGNIVLSQPLEPLVPVYNIAGYFAKGGQIPTMAIMPNEVSTTAGSGFQVLSEILDEPPIGAAPSQTLLAKRWNCYSMPSMTVSLLCHHIQVKISFPQENFPSTIFGIALNHDRADA